MSTIPSPDMRLPSYEGHLILNQATLSDIPQTSSCTAWSEQWCSLEDGRLLVYPDHTAAIVNPDETSAVIDIRDFASVHVSAVSSEQAFELTLSTAPPPSSSSGRMFLTKSVASLHRLLPDQALHRNASEHKHHPPTAYHARVSMPPLALSPPPKLSARADKDHSRGLARKPWSKSTSGSERLYGPASTSSNGSLRTMATMHIREGSTSSSAYSSSNSRTSTDFASSGAPSPRTPISPTFSDSTECISMRVASTDALAQWVEAISLTIKMHRETTATSIVVKKQRKALTRPSLSSLSGFRTPTNFQSRPASPSQGAFVEGHDDEATPKASRDRRESATSFAFTPAASRILQDKSEIRAANSTSGSKQQGLHAVAVSALDGENASSGASQRGPATGPHTPTSLTFVVDRKASKRERTHKRSLSLASSSFSLSSGRRMSGDRRSSLTGRQPLPSGSNANPLGQGDAASCAVAPSQCAVAQRTETTLATQKVCMAIDDEVAAQSTRYASVATRHRRSGSLLHFGSSRVMAWRDTFTASNARAPAEAPLGLGLLFDKSDTSESRQTSLSSSVHSLSKGTSKLPKIRSFRFLPTIKMINSDGDASALNDDDMRLRSPRTLRCASGARSPSITPPQGQGMSRTTSLLSLTKNALSSLRGKSSRPHASSFPGQGETPQTPKRSSESTARIGSPGFEFSYELVQPTRQTDSNGASMRDSVPDMVRTSSTHTPRMVPIAGEERLADADRSISRSGTDDMNDASSPSLPVERILPPEQIISTFDQLRAADPTGRSCDWLDRIETATRRGSVDWAAAETRPNRPSLRLAASQSFVSHDGSSGQAIGPRLRSSMSAWNLPAASPTERPTRRFDADERQAPSAVGTNVFPKQLNASNACETRHSLLAPRSLPAPPRAYKRRARISTFTPPPSALLPPAEVGASPTRRASPFADMTNSPSSRRDDSLPKTMHKLGLSSPSRSPKRLGGVTRRRSGIARRPT
ncbi:Pleckstrin homology-like domain protein [Kalmanozyma brasiliensis GHG001]|uniref:Pleckstrin homology-like domain protein n=1 Tax=Kalmanozyma brasiliensis (strain GHG001) TaxID=1365824 RepID=UPI002867E8A5|nr:Pleckstrin homology-like domain protein [Kalmanozyma brasiliensis GHG001]KAF6767397.1 Pleckstrin homology-like domain protein [Kalmanozyma brasiliensis GHG001]